MIFLSPSEKSVTKKGSKKMDPDDGNDIVSLKGGSGGGAAEQPLKKEGSAPMLLDDDYLHITSAIPDKTISDVRRRLQALRQKHDESSESNPFFISSVMEVEGNITGETHEQFAVQFVVGQHQKRHQKSIRKKTTSASVAAASSSNNGTKKRKPKKQEHDDDDDLSD